MSVQSAKAVHSRRTPQMPQQWDKKAQSDPVRGKQCKLEEKREEDGNEKADRPASHGVVEAADRDVSRSRSKTFTPEYGEAEGSKQSESRSRSEPPKRRRAKAEQSAGEAKAAQMLQYQDRLHKLKEEELVLEDNQRLEEAKLQVAAKERRNKQLLHNINKTKRRLMEMQEEDERSARKGGVQRAQLKSQSASSMERRAQSSGYATKSEAENDERKERKAKRGEKSKPWQGKGRS